MKVGLGSYALRWAIGTNDFQPPNPLTSFTLLDKAAALDAEVVQICDNLPLTGLSDNALADLAHHAADLNLSLEVGIKGSQPDHLQCHLEITERLGARLLRVVLTAPGWKPSFDECVAIFKALLPDLHARGITIAIENHFYLRPAELARLIQLIDDPLVGVCLDPLNSITMFVSPVETITTLAPLAVSVHVKNATITRPQTGFYIGGCPLDEGLVDLPEMMDTVRAAGRSPNVLVECWMDQLDDPVATLAQEEAWTRRGIVYVHQLLNSGVGSRE